MVLPMVPDMIPPISIDELKEAWPAYLARTERTNVKKAVIPLPLPVSIRCRIMQTFLKSGGEPTELLLAIVAQMPLDGSLLKDEMQRPLSL
jgi:hypothetical protein